MLIEYEFEDGKYKVIRDEDTCELVLYRNGLYWEAGTYNATGDKLFHSMLNEIDRLREYELMYKDLCN
jgi:hypothetical protein